LKNFASPSNARHKPDHYVTLYLVDRSYPKVYTISEVLQQFSQEDLKASGKPTFVMFSRVGTPNAILEYRKSQGDFKEIEDLKKVPGVDEKVLETLKSRLYVKK